jgi:DNA-binding Lrp family transcriptional regulator
LLDDASLNLQRDVRRSFRLLAKKLGVAEDTVRKRVQRYRDEGLFRGWNVGLNPAALGFRTSYLFFELDSAAAKDRVIGRLRELPRVLWVDEYLGDFAGALTAYRNEAELRETTERASGPRVVSRCSRVDTEFPATEMRLLEVDRRIVAAIREDPRRPFADIARAIGRSPRTVRRRLRRMIDAHALFALPDVDLERLRGGAVVTLGVSVLTPGDRTAIEARVLSRFGQYHLFTPPRGRTYAAYTFLLPNLALVEAIRSWVSGLPGVDRVSVRPLVRRYNRFTESLPEESARGAPRLGKRPRLVAAR